VTNYNRTFNPFIFINEKRRDIQAEVATDLKLLSSAEGVCGLANGGNQPLVSAQVVYDLDGGGGGGGVYIFTLGEGEEKLDIT